ncbi:MAG: DNA-processing protein DprA, partial [Chitinophagales bacterium]|nr:DNA-processing protein DprA [Chitinophagales bacterium]
MQEELFYHIALKFVPDIGSAVIKNLVSWCGNAKFIFTTSKGKLQKIPLVGEIRAKKILDKNIQHEAFRKAEKELAFIDKHKIECLFYNDKQYPQRLLQCDDAPSLLFFKGSCDLNHERIIAVVGTRSASEYGKEITKKIVSELSKARIMIISGLALGIDGVAHTAALANEIPTVGILGHGLNRIYPENHRNLAKQMLRNGGLLTEYTSQCAFHPSNFPQRNRIVAGLCDALLVVETDVKGGAVITANIANSYNREVFAVPGAVGTKSARGCHFLIKTHKAMLIENAEDV